jgi:hypothetical protein
VLAQLIAAIIQAIRVAGNDLIVETAGLHLLDKGPGIRCLKDFSRRNAMFT